MIGSVSSTDVYSNLKYTGSAISNRFYTTVENQELILFNRHCNSITVEADATDIYFTIVRGGADSPATYNYINEPVIYVKAGNSISVDGIDTIGIKLSNALGAKIYVVGTAF